MKITRLVSSAAIAGAMALSSAGVALAADTVIMDTTGPFSTNNASVNHADTVTITNTNDVTVTNDNTQTATSGDADASFNTNGGSASTGNASNNNTTSTTIAINNHGLAVGGFGGNVGGGSNVGGGGNVGGGTGGGSALGGSHSNVGGGSLALAGGVGGGTLPETGAIGPVDVSSLVNAFKPSAQAQELAKQTQGTSRALLAMGALLSLLGAVGSAVYAHKKEVKA